MVALKRVLSLSALRFASGGPCAELDTLLDLNAWSYPKGSVCHALFWKTSRGLGPICFHSTATAKDCPTKYPVTVQEAEAEITRIRNLWDNPVNPTLASTTTEVQASSPTNPAVILVTESLIDSSQPERTTTTTASVQLLGVEWVKPRGPVELEAFVKQTESPLELLVLGDIGYANAMLANTMKTARRKIGAIVDSAILLGDNFYPVGINTNVDDPQFAAVFEKIVTKEFPTTDFHAILGNHDWMGNADAQLQYSDLNSHWIMPYYYYRRRFVASDGSSTCIWFLDTENLKPKRGKGSADQLAWLVNTLGDSSCRWKIVVGHHPIYDAGEYRNSEWMISNVVPVLENNGVSLYISGHEHQTQVLYNEAVSSVRYIISGCTAERRSGVAVANHPMRVWQETKSTAFLQLSISNNRLVYRIHKGAGDPEAPPMYEAFIEKL